MADKVNKPIYKKWWFWVLLVLVVIIFANMGDEEETAENEGTTQNATNTTDNNASPDEGAQDETTQNEEPAKDVYAVGEEVQLGDNVLTVTNVEKSQGDDFDKPKEGHEYVIVTVQIKNAGSENISYNPFDFKMANSQGQILDQAFTIIDTDTSLQSGELAPGGNVSGTIVFEQPTGDTGLQLQYTPSFWGDDTVKVNLQ